MSCVLKARVRGLLEALQKEIYAIKSQALLLKVDAELVQIREVSGLYSVRRLWFKILKWHVLICAASTRVEYCGAETSCVYRGCGLRLTRRKENHGRNKIGKLRASFRCCYNFLLSLTL